MTIFRVLSERRLILLLTVWIAAGLAISSMLLTLGSLWRPVRLVVDALGLAAAFVFFVIVAVAVMKTIGDDTVFMTQVHEILLEPLFLICGAWLGPYTMMRLWLVLLRNVRTGGRG